jgi:hypothetical protein
MNDLCISPVFMRVFRIATSRAECGRIARFARSPSTMEDMEDKRGAAIRSDAARFQSVLLTDFDCITIPAAHM